MIWNVFGNHIVNQCFSSTRIIEAKSRKENCFPIVLQIVVVVVVSVSLYLGIIQDRHLDTFFLISINQAPFE